MEANKHSYCKHVATAAFAEISQFVKVPSNDSTPAFSLPASKNVECSECRAQGSNLWLCLHKGCGKIFCGESQKDHSGEHNLDQRNHCVHLNLSTHRIWCYGCDNEVIVTDNSPTISPLVQSALKRQNDNKPKALPPSSSLASLKDMADTYACGTVGLQNLGNTCYMNSALQALSNVQPMTSFFVNQYAGQDRETKKPSIAKAYSGLMKDIWNESSPPYVVPANVLYAVKMACPMFRGFQQHDSQEFLRCFMDQLHEELKEPLVEDNPGSWKSRDPQAETNSDSSEDESSDSYMTCDSGVSDNEGSDEGVDYDTSRSKRLRTNSENEFADALDRLSRSPSPRRPPPMPSPEQKPEKYRSIVSDIFDGKILSSVQCLVCSRVSSRVETFQDLSLSIPSKDQLSVIHQATTSRNHSLATPPRGWMSWMWTYVWSWFWGPTVNLYDCLSAFFSADELKGDNMYSCEKCKKLRNGVKFSSIIELPEVLTIHLKRFRHELLFSSKISSHISFPLTSLDMKLWTSRESPSQVTSYDLVAVIVHHGTAGGGHYTCYALNCQDRQWYEFDDSRVRRTTPETVANCQAYVLFYKKYSEEMEDFRRQVSDLAEETADPSSSSGEDSLLQFYLSRQWFEKFATFAEPGPIQNGDFLCPHGGVQPLKMAKIEDYCFAVNESIWEALHKKFGGGPVCNRLYSCAICQREQEVLDKRRKDELEHFLQLRQEAENQINVGGMFAISMTWFRRWESFVKNRDVLPPGPIDNLPISVVRNGVRTLRSTSDYAQLLPSQWLYFLHTYGGGPEIISRP